MEKILISGLSQVGTTWLGGRVITRPTWMKWASGWLGRSLPPSPPKRSVLSPFGILLTRYLISHLLLHAQLPMECYFLVFYPRILPSRLRNIWQLYLLYNPVFWGVGGREGWDYLKMKKNKQHGKRILFTGWNHKCYSNFARPLLC